MKTRAVCSLVSVATRLGILAAVVLGLALPMRATTYYFDTTSSSGLGSHSGTNNWNTSTTEWTTSSSGSTFSSRVAWTGSVNSTSNNATFGTTSGGNSSDTYTMNIADGIKVGTVTITGSDNVTFSINSSATWTVTGLSSSGGTANLTFSSGSIFDINGNIGSSSNTFSNLSLYTGSGNTGATFNFGGSNQSVYISDTSISSISSSNQIVITNSGTSDYVYFTGISDSNANSYASGGDISINGSTSVSWNSSGNYFYLNSIPEPSSVAALLGIGAFGFAAYRRRRSALAAMPKKIGAA